MARMRRMYYRECPYKADAIAIFGETVKCANCHVHKASNCHYNDARKNQSVVIGGPDFRNVCPSRKGGGLRCNMRGAMCAACPESDREKELKP